MFSIIAFSESIDAGGVLQPLTAVPDQHVRTQGDDVIVPEMNKLLGAMACTGASATVVRLISPSLRRFNGHRIEPLNLGLVPGATINHDVDYSGEAQLETSEALQAEQNGNPAAAEQVSVVVWLSDSKISPLSGNIRPVRFQVTVAQVAGAWSAAIIDFIDELPVGTVKVVGGALIAAGAVAFRFVPVGGKNRPGAPVKQTAAGFAGIPFRAGYLGEWFTFHTSQPPMVEVLGSAAAGAATYEGVMDCLL